MTGSKSNVGGVTIVAREGGMPYKMWLVAVSRRSSSIFASYSPSTARGLAN